MSSPREEFLKYYEEFKTPIFNYLYYRTGYHRMLAEDLTEEVFLKAFEHFDSYQPARPFKNWIFTIAHNELINYYRQKQGKDVSLDELEDVLPSGDTHLSEQVDMKMDLERVTEILQLLPDSQRNLLSLKYINELSYEEIADITGKEEGTVRVAVHRALKALQERYQKLHGHQ